MDELVERSLRQSALWDEVKDRLRQSALDNLYAIATFAET
jgi:ABC-type phosphate transport system ATPase subunit